MITNNQLQIINILNAYIYNSEFILLKNLDWNEIKEECDLNNISSVVYLTIRKSKNIEILPNELFESWKRETIISSIREVNQFNEISKIIKVFDEEKVNLISLKGIITRNFYNNPENRVMGDGDFLIREDDIEISKKILMNLGYRIVNIQGKHEIFIAQKNGFKSLEFHRTIRRISEYQLNDEFEKDIWENILKMDFENNIIKSLSLEDFILHNFMHMARHFESLGFGIRHLLDIVLILKVNEKNIDWNTCLEKLKKQNLERFSKIILGCCNRLFNLKCCIVNEEFIYENIDLIDLVINDIFEAGIFGKKNNKEIFEKSIAKDNREKNTSILNRINKNLFPDSNSLSEKYSYAKENKALLPIAWVHRITNGLKSAEYNNDAKKTFVVSLIKPNDKRGSLIKELL